MKLYVLLIVNVESKEGLVSPRLNHLDSSQAKGGSRGNKETGQRESKQSFGQHSVQS